MDAITKAANAVADSTHDAYSFDLHYRAKDWRAIAAFLMREGYGTAQVTTILRSKHMRWAGDQMLRNRQRYVTPAQFATYFRHKNARNGINDMLANEVEIDVVDASPDRKVIRGLIRELRTQASIAHGDEHGGDCPHRKAGYSPEQVGCICGFSRINRAINRAQDYLNKTGTTSEFEVAPPTRIRAAVGR